MDHSTLIVIVKVFRAYIHLLILLANFANWLSEYEQRQHERRNLRQRTFTRFQIRSVEIQRITRESDIICVNELRMDRNAFAMLCELLKTRGGLLDDGNVTIEEQLLLMALPHPPFHKEKHHQKREREKLVFLTMYIR